MADPDQQNPDVEDVPEYGTLTVEDEDVETVDPADVANTADESDDDPPSH